MRKRYGKRYDWNLFGKHEGFYIIGRLDWINGKPMVWVAMLNLFLLIVNIVFDKFCVNIPEVSVLTSFWGWNLFNLIAKIAFWVLFVDGVIVNFLWSFTRGKYSVPYWKRLLLFPELDNKAEVKEELSWAWFLFTHPEFDYKVQKLKEKYTVNRRMAGLAPDPEGYAHAYVALEKEYGVMKDEKGRYFTWNDKKYRKFLEQL